MKNEGPVPWQAPPIRRLESASGIRKNPVAVSSHPVPVLHRRRSFRITSVAARMLHTSLAESLFSAISAPFCKCRLGIDRTLWPYAVKPVLRLRLLTAGLRVRAQARLHLQVFISSPFYQWRKPRKLHRQKNRHTRLDRGSSASQRIQMFTVVKSI